MKGTGVTRSALWKDIGDAQLVISTQDSKNVNKSVSYILFRKLLITNEIKFIIYSVHNIIQESKVKIL